MDKERLLTYLLNNISCFRNVTLNDFCLLATLETDELEFVNEKVSQITPLLQQISDYASIRSIMIETDIEKIGGYIDEKNTMLNDCIEVIETCYRYIEILKKENCHHPSVLVTIDLLNGLTIYNQLNNILCKTIEKVEDEFQDDLIDISTKVDDNLIEITEELFNHILIKLKKRVITSKEDLILNLSNYARNFLTIVMLISKNKSIYQIEDKSDNILYLDNTYIHLFKNDRIHPDYNLTILEALDSLLLLIQKVEEYINEYSDEIDSNIEELLDDLKESYLLYENFRYQYLKDSYKEQKLLKKCKKL